MKSLHKIVGGLLLLGSLSVASCGQKPVFFPKLPVSDIQAYFSEAAQTQAIDTAFYEVKDASGNLLGTVLFSSPYSDAVQGFNGPTPLLIALDSDGRIKNVVLMDHQETPRFAQRVVDGSLRIMERPDRRRGLGQGSGCRKRCHLHLQRCETQPQSPP